MHLAAAMFGILLALIEKDLCGPLKSVCRPFLDNFVQFISFSGDGTVLWKQGERVISAGPVQVRKDYRLTLVEANSLRITNVDVTDTGTTFIWKGSAPFVPVFMAIFDSIQYAVPRTPKTPSQWVILHSFLGSFEILLYLTETFLTFFKPF